MKLFYHSLFLIGLVACFFSCETKKNSTVTYVDNNQIVLPDSIKAIGIWEVPMNERSIEGKHGSTRWASSPGFHIFEYDGKYANLLLGVEHDWMYRTPDDYYKVATKWGHDTLYWLPPFGRWEELAIFNDSNFYTSQELYKKIYTWKYVKIYREQVPVQDSAILKKRKPHDYSIKPMDQYKE